MNIIIDSKVFKGKRKISVRRNFQSVNCVLVLTIFLLHIQPNHTFRLFSKIRKKGIKMPAPTPKKIFTSRLIGNCKYIFRNLYIHNINFLLGRGFNITVHCFYLFNHIIKIRRETYYHFL